MSDSEEEIRGDDEEHPVKNDRSDSEGSKVSVSSSSSSSDSSSSSSSDSSSPSLVASKTSKNAPLAGEREEIDKAVSDAEYPQSQNLLESSDDDDDDEPDKEEEPKPQLKEETEDQNAFSQNLLASSDDDGEDDKKPKFREAGEENEPKKKAKKKRILPIPNAHSKYKREAPKDPVESASLPVDVADWDRLAATKWGRNALYKYMTARESSILVGLATTYADEEPKIEFPMDGESPEQADDSDSKPSFQDPAETNPLIGLPNDPMPPSYLHHIVRGALEAEEFDESLNHAFDASAMVAIGMLVEEMVTASLLPLAGLHVLRCRELEDASSDEPIDQDRQSKIHPISGQVVQTLRPSSFRKEDNSFQEWTLPPEEALHKLYMDGRFQPDTFPTVTRPTCRINPRFQPDSSLKHRNRFKRDNFCRIRPESMALDSLIAANHFIFTHHLNPKLVRDNMDFFGLFLSLDPSTLNTKLWHFKKYGPVKKWIYPRTDSETDNATSKVAGQKRKST
jgi:hypothetical protein